MTYNKELVMYLQKFPASHLDVNENKMYSPCGPV